MAHAERKESELTTQILNCVTSFSYLEFSGARIVKLGLEFPCERKSFS